MILTKKATLEILETMPEKFSAQEFIDAIIIGKIKIAQQQVKDGDFLTEEEMDAEIQNWPKTAQTQP